MQNFIPKQKLEGWIPDTPTFWDQLFYQALSLMRPMEVKEVRGFFLAYMT